MAMVDRRYQKNQLPGKRIDNITQVAVDVRLRLRFSEAEVCNKLGRHDLRAPLPSLLTPADCRDLDKQRSQWFAEWPSGLWD